MADKTPGANRKRKDRANAKRNRPTKTGTDREAQYTTGSFGSNGSAIGTSAIVVMSASSAVAVAYAKAFAETLAKNNAETLIKFIRTHVLGKGEKADTLITLDDNEAAAAAVIVPGDAPDEARLALLDLDVTAQELRGKTLRWNVEAQAWLPTDL